MPGAEHRLSRPGWRRGLLWLAFGGLLLALLVTAALLARRFQEDQAQQQLELEADTLANDLRSGLARNVQTLQSLAFQPMSAGEWWGPALEILEQNREMALLERRDRAMHVVVSRSSPFHIQPPEAPPRSARQAEVAAACTLARRSRLSSYTAAYDWHLASGKVEKAMDMCMPKLIDGELVGYLVVAYSLPGLQTELLDSTATRGRTTELADMENHHWVSATAQRQAPTQVAEHVLELNGHVLVLQLERPRSALSLTPWSITSLVGGMSALIVLVAALLGRDMTLRLKAEHGLAEALAVRKAMENSLVTGLQARDLQGRITYVNPAFCHLVGLSADQLLGNAHPLPYWPTDMAEAHKRHKAAQHTGAAASPQGIESTFVRPDGAAFPVLIFETPLLNAQGTHTGWMSAVLDLTEQHRAEAASRASQEQLQATARLASVGEMASLLSHELNQPLSAIASYAAGSLNLLAQAEHPPEAVAQDMAEAMTRIREQAERAGRVIRSVGNFVRRREQASGLVREPVALHNLVQTVLPLVNLQAKRDGIRVVVDIATDCPELLCDRTMVEQVLLNLARNGMQAMTTPNPDTGTDHSTPAHLRTLTLSAQPAAQPTGADTAQALGAATGAVAPWVEIGISDHGHGLSDAVAQRLFTPFFSTRAQGMGLGLSLCRTVVEQHGGTLTHAPAQPCGTVFRMTLPTVAAGMAANMGMGPGGGARPA